MVHCHSGITVGHADHVQDPANVGIFSGHASKVLQIQRVKAGVKLVIELGEVWTKV